MRRSGLTRTSVYTKKLPDSYKSTDITDDSAIVTLPPSFDIMKKGKPFIIERPAFKKGTASAIIDEGKRTANLQNNRSGLGNNLIIRQSFETPNVRPRQATAYALQELLAQQQQGIKVQLGDKTLRDLFKLVTVDPDDKVWLAVYATEFKRLIDEGKSEDEAKEILKASPPLGRPQRPMTKMVNFGSVVDLSQKSSLSLNEKLDALAVAISSLSAVELPTTLAKVMAMLVGIESFTPEQCAKISALLDSTKAVPTDYSSTDYGLGHAIFSYDQYISSDMPLIKTFLGANIPEGLQPHRPVFNSDGSPISWKQIQQILRLPYNAVDQAGEPILTPNYQYYLNLQERRIMTRADTLDLVNNAGVDSGKLNGENPPLGLIGESPHWLTDEEQAIAITKKKTLKTPELETEPEPEPEPEIPELELPTSPLGGEPLSLDVDEPVDEPVDPFKSPPPRPPREPVLPPPTPSDSWLAGARIQPINKWDFGAFILPSGKEPLDKFYPNAWEFFRARTKLSYQEVTGKTAGQATAPFGEIWKKIKADPTEFQRWENARIGLDPDADSEINRYYYLTNIRPFGEKFPELTSFAEKRQALIDQWNSLSEIQKNRWVLASRGLNPDASEKA